MVRRFEREIQGRRRFWEVDLRGTELTVSSGEVGRAGRTNVRKLRSADLAARELADAVKQMLDGGWEEVVQPSAPSTPDEAHAAVLAAPDDPGAYLVLGDRLQALGDPRGELVAIQAALASGEDRASLHDAERALLEAHGATWLGGLSGVDARPLAASSSAAPWEPAGGDDGLRPPGPNTADLDWFCGFIRGLRIEAEGYGTRAAEVFQGLVDAGSLPFLRHLRVEGPAQLDAVAHALGRRTWPVLEALELGHAIEGGDEPAALTWPVGKLLETLPALRWLQVALSPAGMGVLVHDRLESLSLKVPDGRVLRDLDLTGLTALCHVEVTVLDAGTTEWPALARALDVPLDSLAVRGPDTVGFVEAAVPRAHLPRRLVLGPAPNGPAIVHALQLAGDRFAGVSIGLVGIDVSDGDLEDLAGLSVGTDLPDVRVSRRRQHLSDRQEAPRRFERDGRYWEIVREGAVVRARWGAVGAAGASSEHAHASPESAAADYRKRVRTKRASGWREVGVPALTGVGT